MGYSKGQHPQHWTLSGENGSRHWAGLKQVQMSSTWPSRRSILHDWSTNTNLLRQHCKRAARNNAQKTARHYSNDYCVKLCKNIQLSFHTGEFHRMYDQVHHRPKQMQDSTIEISSWWAYQGHSKQMERWVEHYLELYSKESSILGDMQDTIAHLSALERLDTMLTAGELSNVTDMLPIRKISGLDDIPPEAIKCTKGVLLDHMVSLLCQCWVEGMLPQDIRDCYIVTLYKNKKDWSDYNSYRGISLLYIIGKVFSYMFLGRLQRLAERGYPKSQYGFKLEHSMTDMIFFQQLQKKCQEQKQPLFMAFIDLTKAGMACSRYSTRSVVLRDSSKLSSCFMVEIIISSSISWRASYNLMTLIQELSVSASVWSRVMCLHLPYSASSQSCWNMHLGIQLKLMASTCTHEQTRLFSLSQLRVKSKVCEVLIIETCCLQTMQHCQHVWRATAASNGQFFKSLPRVQFDHQSEEDQCNGPRHWTASCHRRL